MDLVKHLNQRGGGEPGILAPGAGRGEHSGESELLRRPGHLPEVIEVRRPLCAGRAGRGMLCPRPTIVRPSPEVGRNQSKINAMSGRSPYSK